MSITLAKDAVTATLPDPLSPYGSEAEPRQVTRISGGGVPRVSETGDPDLVFRLRFKSVTNSQASDLVDFIEDTIDYAANTFTFTDTFSTAFSNMRYVSGRSTWKRGRGGKWAGELVIRQDLGV